VIEKGPTRKQDKARRDRLKAKNYRAVCALVDERDEGRCRVCECWCLAEPHHHHLTYRGRGGKDTTANVILVCHHCHAEIHAERLKVEGNADKRLLINGEKE